MLSARSPGNEAHPDTCRDGPVRHSQKPRRFIRLLKRKLGVTAAEFLGCADASVRVLVSRLEQHGAEITRRKERWHGGTVYTLIERFSGRKDRSRVTTAQAAKLTRQGGFKPPGIVR